MTGLRNSLTAALVLGGLPAAALAQISPAGPALADVTAALGLERAELTTVDLDGIPGQNVTAWVELDGQERLMVLEPKSVRAPGFQVLEDLGDGAYQSIEPSTVVTYRGMILDMPEVQVAASWLDDGLHARLLHTDGTSDWLEPLAGRVSGADLDTYAVYGDEDVRKDHGVCGVSDAERATRSPFVQSDEFGDDLVAFGSQLKIAELGIDTDYEYFLDYGSTGATQNQIESVINTMNLQYEQDVFITHQITTVIIRSNPNDPYTTSSPTGLLEQFRQHWISQQGSVQRDVAHLFTGKNLSGGVIGIAYLGAICSNNIGYGLVESDCCGSFASKTDLSAHELGHNWNADHCNCTSPNYTMNAFLTVANRFSPTQTIPALINYANNRPCLEDGTGAGPAPVIDSVSPPAITVVDPNSPTIVTLNGSGFNNIDGVSINGEPLVSFPPTFQVKSDTELEITFLPPVEVGPKAIVVTEGSDTASTTLTVFGNNTPTIDLADSDPDFLISFLPIRVYMGGPANDTHFLLASTSDQPTNVPGLFSADIGDNLNSLFLLGTFTIDPATRVAEGLFPISGIGTGTKLYFQSVVLPAANPVLPLTSSNVEVGTVLF